MTLAFPRSLVTLLLLVGVAAPASAVPPKGAAVLRVASAAQPAPAWVEAAYLEVGSPGHPPRLALRVSASPAGAIRQDIQDLSPGGPLSTQVWAPVGAAPRGAAVLDEAPGWLQLLSGRPLEAVLHAKGVDPRATSFAHDGATILWVIGAGPHAPEVPQVHVERESGRLRRFTERIPGPPAGDGAASPARIVTVRLTGRAPGGGERAAWPERVEIEAAGRVVAFALQGLTIGEPFGAERFATEPEPEPEPAAEPPPEPGPDGAQGPAPPAPALPTPAPPALDPRGTTL